MFGHTPLDRIDRLLKEVATLKPDEPASPAVLEALRRIMQSCNVQDTSASSLSKSNSNTSPRSQASTSSSTSTKSNSSAQKPQRFVVTHSPTSYNKSLYI